jgi:hypothetical protein
MTFLGKVGVLAAATVLAAGAAQAQVRVAPDTTSFLDPANPSAARLLFGRHGYFMIAGGVVLGGSADFFIERNGTDTPVPAQSVALAAAPDGSVRLRYGAASYAVGMPAALACPLARFVARDGVVAYTVPKFMDTDSRHALMRLHIKHHTVAEEFDGTGLEPLLRAADFAATVPLSPPLARDLSASLNHANGLDSFVVNAAEEDARPIGSLINSDIQVRYRVYLQPATHTVDIAGVPLRYFWELNQGGSAGVFAVAALAQNWPAGSHLSAPGEAPTQYDAVNFYQVAGLFREMHVTAPAGFEAFVEQACHGSI